MEIIGKVAAMFDLVKTVKRKDQTVGVVPTMGALHAGHLSLVRRAKQVCDYVVTTIFVNPTQFAPQEDLEKYPRPIESDLEKLQELQVDAVFCPTNEDIYPAGFSTYVNPPEISLPLEGSLRQNHFRGVTTVVLKLFQIVPAQFAFFGQKDYQQSLVIKKMVEDLNLPVEIEVCPIIRDPDGLALSSRNAYLSSDDRQRALALSKTLRHIKEQVLAGAAIESTLAESSRNLSGSVDELEYLVLVDAQTLLPIDSIKTPGVLLVAAKVGKTRLIDNELVGGQA